MLRASLIGLLVVIAGCDANWWDPTRFPPLRGGSTIHATGFPGNTDFPTGRYGSVVVGYDTLLPDPSITLPGRGSPNLISSRFVVSGGRSSAFYMWRGFEDRATSDRTTTGMRAVVSGTSLLDGCTDREFCGDGASPSIAAFDVLPGAALSERETEFSCVAVPAGAVNLTGGVADERLNIRCETTASRILAVPVDDGIDFGASAAGLPAIRSDSCAPRPHGVGLALFGAPRAHDQDGGLFALRATPGAAVYEVDLSALDLPPLSSLGSQMAAVALSDDTALVVVSARSEENLATPRVVVMTLTGSPGGVTSHVHACLGGTSSHVGFGRSLAIGELDGAAGPEIAIGAADARSSTAGQIDAPIEIYSFAALSGLTLAGCSGDPAPAAAHRITCGDVPELECADLSIADRSTIGFGAALAIGQIDGSGPGDLVIGAPHARIEGVRSGAVVSLRGASALTGLGSGEGGSAIRAPSNRVGAMQFGYAVAALRGSDRDEIVAGAPGVQNAYVVFCSGLDGDRAADLRDEEGVTRGCVVPVVGGAPPACGGGSDAGTPDAGVSDTGIDDDAGL